MSEMLPPARSLTPPVPAADGYVVHEFLGRGSSGTVWRATQEGTLREVALKFLAPWHGHGLAGVRFAREVEIAASMEHENIARVFDSVVAPSGSWLAMELVDGPPADRWVAETNPPLRERIGLFQRICAGVRHAHQRGVIHRDLKPGNVLVASDGMPKVVDFGLACRQDGPSLDATLTREGEVFGTLAWMAPEQAAGRWADVDALSDVYALGAILFGLIAGAPPLDPALPPAALLAAAQAGHHRRLREADPSAPRDLESIVEKCLAAEKVRRYQSVAELEADVNRWQAGDPVRARSAAPLYWLGKKVRRHWLGATAAALIASSAIGMAWGYLQGQQSLAEQKRLASEREAAQTARTLHEAQELVAQLLVEMRPKLEDAGHPEWIAEIEERLAAFPWDIGGNGGGAYDPRRFRGRAALFTGEVLARQGQWGGALKSYQETIRQLKPLAEEHPEAAIFREELGRARIGEEMALLKLGFHKEAVAAGQKALDALTPPPGQPLAPALVDAMVEATCILAEASFSAKGKTDDALEMTATVAQRLPPGALPEAMALDDARAHARIGRELARLTAAVKGPAQAEVIAVRAMACARRAWQLTGNGEVAGMTLALALATDADIARMQGHAGRALDRLTEATAALGGKSARPIALSFSAQPAIEVAQAWERYAVWMEETDRLPPAIEGNNQSLVHWGKVRQRMHDAGSIAAQPRLLLRNAHLSRRLNLVDDAVRYANLAVRKSGIADQEGLSSAAMCLDAIEAALILAELQAPERPGKGPWPLVADETLRRMTEKGMSLHTSEKRRRTTLEAHLESLRVNPSPGAQ